MIVQSNFFIYKYLFFHPSFHPGWPITCLPSYASAAICTLHQLLLLSFNSEINVTEHVVHTGKSEICTKFRQLKAKISPWKCSICGKIIIELILMLWHQIKCPVYYAKDPQVKWPQLLFMFLAVTLVNFFCQRVKERYGLDSCD